MLPGVNVQTGTGSVPHCWKSWWGVAVGKMVHCMVRQLVYDLEAYAKVWQV